MDENENTAQTIAIPLISNTRTWGNKLVKALSAVQAKALIAKRNSNNPYFSSSYSDLCQVWETCRDPLAKNGFAVIQRPFMADGKMMLETILAHESGEWISGNYSINPVKIDPQSMGSAITYAKRYSLAAMVGVVSEGEDDDGNVASDLPKAKAINRIMPHRQTADQLAAERATEDVLNNVCSPAPEPPKRGNYAPFWAKTFDNAGQPISYLFARDGKCFSAQWLTDHGFVKGPKVWKRAYDEKIEIICKEIVSEYEEREPGEGD